MTWIRFGRAAELVTEKSSNGSFKVGLEAIESNTGRLLDVDAEYQGDGVAFEEDDILFGKLRPYLAKSWLADRSGSAVGDFHVYRARPGISPRYLHHVTLSQCFLAPVVASVYGAKMPRAGWDLVRDIEIDLPEYEAQLAVANYLDRETAQIDTLIAKQEQLIHVLRERRISAEVSALDGPARMPLRRLISPARPLTYGIVQAGPHVEDGIRYIGPSDMNGHRGVLDPTTLRRTSQAIAAQYSRSAVAGGDLVVSIGPAFGKTMRVPNELEGANLTQDTARVACDTDFVEPEYVLRALRSVLASDFWDAEIAGATFRRLNLNTLARTPIPLPPLDEQRRIVAHLDEQTAKIDALIAKAERFIELAKERRAALITAAVTGQLDVTAA